MVIQRPYLRSLSLCFLLLFTISTAFLSIFVGSRDIVPTTTWQALTAFDSSDSLHLIVHHLRIPRAILAIVVGLAMGGAGAIIQTLTRNPLADPGLLGVNSGATLGVVIAIAAFGFTDIQHYMWFSILGAMVAGVIIYFLAGLSQDVHPIRVVLSGMALSVILLALTQLITVNSNEATFGQFRHWVVGSLQGRGFDIVLPITVMVCLGLMYSMLLTKALNTLALGRELSQSLGINHTHVWLSSALAITLLSGAATAAVGPLSFIGLTAPHIARFLVGSDHRWLLPYSMVVSALMIAVADMVGKMIIAPDEVSVGIMSALLGGPMFVFLVRKWKMAEL